VGSALVDEVDDVVEGVVAGDPAVDDGEHADTAEFEPVAGGRKSYKLTLVRPPGGPDLSDHVALGDERLARVVEIREGLHAHALKRLGVLHGLLKDTRGEAVADPVRSQELVEDVEVPAVVGLLVAADDLLVAVGLLAHLQAQAVEISTAMPV